MDTHTVRFQPGDVTVEVDSKLYPYGRHGEPGSLLDIALTHGVHIEHACGGTGVCGTCHVIVEAGEESLSPADDDEMDTVDRVADNQLNSRLACRAVVRGGVTVRIPAGQE
ncbi:MAG: 2Fe-2S iron-sulfur cluster-binding protein [Planctomycetota bacterium]|jgi:2Fe-2S ferredoxin